VRVDEAGADDHASGIDNAIEAADTGHVADLGDLIGRG